jgi:uncharacterized phiE125 gp8 family phage protein
MSYTILTVDRDALPANLLPLAKQHLRITFDDDDETLTHYLRHAIRQFENFSGWQISMAEVEWLPETAGQACVSSPIQPVSGFTVDDAGVDVSADYELRTGLDMTAPVFLCRKDDAAFPAGIKVGLVAGYVDADDLDPAAESAVLRIAATLYEHRESVTTLSVEQMPFWMNDILCGIWVPRV